MGQHDEIGSIGHVAGTRLVPQPRRGALVDTIPQPLRSALIDAIVGQR